jgi:hypothetical protein
LSTSSVLLPGQKKALATRYSCRRAQGFCDDVTNA